MRWHVGLWRVRNGWKLAQIEWKDQVVMVLPVLGFAFGVMRHINVDNTGSWSLFVGPLHIEWCWRIQQ